MLQQLISFFLVGLANTAVGLSIIFLLKGVFGASDILANLLGYGVGLCVSFLLNRRFTFRHSGVIWGTAIRFGLVTVIAYCANLAFVLWLIHAGVDSYLSQTLGNVPYAAIGFLGSRYFVFRHARK